MSLKCVFSCLNEVTLICVEKRDTVLFRLGMSFLGNFCGASLPSTADY